MNEYKEAAQLKLRFQTSQGPLTVEQLWDLNLNQLSIAIKAIKKVLTKDNDDELSFLEDTKVIDDVNELRFEILKDIYMTKKKVSEEYKNAAEKKAHNQKILALIADKEEDSLKNMSIEDLRKML